MDSKSVVDMIEASSRAHFSGFHMDGLQPRDAVEQPSTSVTENMPKQPFVIGENMIMYLWEILCSISVNGLTLSFL